MPQRTLIDIGSRRLAYTSIGSGAPAVVFESGSECDGDSLAELARAAGNFTRAIIYDRAGLGQSDPAPRPRTTRDAAADLAALLRAIALPAPYIIVAHSFGGLIARLHASAHPNDVAGMVLLDTPHPELPLRELQNTPAPTPGEPAALAAFRENARAEWSNPAHNAEGFDWAASARQFPPGEHYGAMPLVVITAGIDEWDEGFPPEVARAQEEAWMSAQRAMLGLSRAGRQIIAAESNHSIQDYQPELVIAVVRELVEGMIPSSGKH